MLFIFVQNTRGARHKTKPSPAVRVSPRPGGYTINSEDLFIIFYSILVCLCAKTKQLESNVNGNGLISYNGKLGLYYF